MNGFDLNYDRWYFDLFAYENEPVEEDLLDWLCDWQSEPWPGVELTGIGDQQAAFAWYHDKQAWKTRRTIRPVYEAAMLLIMSKFVQFIGKALQTAKFSYAIPVFVTAHGFDSIARYAGNERVVGEVAS